MMTKSAVEYWVDATCWSNPHFTTPGEYESVMERAKPAPKRNRLWSFFSRVASVPHFVTQQAAKMVPRSLKTALTQRAEARVLARAIGRLESLSPHLLRDIGVKEMAPGQYKVMKTDEPLVDAREFEPAAIIVPTQRHTPVAKPARRRVRRAMPSFYGAVPH